MKYSMTCSCGHVMDVEAETRDEAITNMQGQMDEAAIAQHMAEKHPGEPVMSVEEVHASIAQNMEPKM